MTFWRLLLERLGLIVGLCLLLVCLFVAPVFLALAGPFPWGILAGLALAGGTILVMNTWEDAREEQWYRRMRDGESS